MMKNKLLLSGIMLAFLISSCNNNPSNSNESPVENSENSESINSEAATSESESVEESIIESADDSFVNKSEFENLVEDNTLFPLDEVSLFSKNDNGYDINESYYLGNDYAEVEGISYYSANENVAVVEDNYIKAKGVGNTIIRVVYDGFYKDITVKVTKEDTKATTFAFDEANMHGKKLAIFGDSVSAQATIGDGKKTYSQLFEETFEMSYRKNYAIGGTTLTYTYPGSNIYKEYANNKTVLDAVQNVAKAAFNHELDNVDYVFIAYGHNDQYFQPPLDSEDNMDDIFNYSNCESYKGSFRWIIRKLRQINPAVRIVVLNCTYSEYATDAATATYGKKYTYADYRKASQEIAEEFNCRYIDPWDYTKKYFAQSQYYKDVVHLTEEGHKVLFDYILKN